MYGALDGPADAGEPTVHATDWPDTGTLELPARPDLVDHVDVLHRVKDESVATAVSQHADALGSAVRGDDLTVLTDGEDIPGQLAHTRDWSVDGTSVSMRMTPVAVSRR